MNRLRDLRGVPGRGREHRRVNHRAEPLEHGSARYEFVPGFLCHPPPTPHPPKKNNKNGKMGETDEGRFLEMCSRKIPRESSIKGGGTPCNRCQGCHSSPSASPHSW